MNTFCGILRDLIVFAKSESVRPHQSKYLGNPIIYPSDSLDFNFSHIALNCSRFTISSKKNAVLVLSTFCTSTSISSCDHNQSFASNF